MVFALNPFRSALKLPSPEPVAITLEHVTDGFEWVQYAIPRSRYSGVPVFSTLPSIVADVVEMFCAGNGE